MQDPLAHHVGTNAFESTAVPSHLVHPEAKYGVGPSIDNGFYYDFSRKDPFTEEDLKKIEKKMEEIVDRDEKTFREVWKRDDAVKHFLKIGIHTKFNLVNLLRKIFLLSCAT